MLKKREEQKNEKFDLFYKKFIKNWIFEIKQKNLRGCTLKIVYF